MSQYFETRKTQYKDLLEVQGTETERGLDTPCKDESINKSWPEHFWFVYPVWSEAYKQGGKRYCFCLNCGERSHL